MNLANFWPWKLTAAHFSRRLPHTIPSRHRTALQIRIREFKIESVESMVISKWLVWLHLVTAQLRSLVQPFQSSQQDSRFCSPQRILGEKVSLGEGGGGW